MKKVWTINVAILLTIIFFAAGNDAFASVDSEGWTLLRKDLYINGKSVAYSSGHTVSLWVKLVPDSGSDLMFEAQKKLMDKGRNDQAIAYEYTGYLSEIDCAKKRHRVFSTILYDVHKNIIHSEDHSPAFWNDISPESSFHLVALAVCR